jgi:hypothetical protein
MFPSQKEWGIVVGESCLVVLFDSEAKRIAGEINYACDTLVQRETKAMRQTLDVFTKALQGIQKIYGAGQEDNRFSWRNRDTVIPSIVKKALEDCGNAR